MQSNGESNLTHTCLSFDCANIVLATDFFQTLNESQDFDLSMLHLHVFAILYSFRVITVLVLEFSLLLFRFYNVCVLQPALLLRVSHMTSTVEPQQGRGEKREQHFRKAPEKYLKLDQILQKIAYSRRFFRPLSIGTGLKAVRLAL